MGQFNLPPDLSAMLQDMKTQIAQLATAAPQASWTPYAGSFTSTDGMATVGSGSLLSRYVLIAPKTCLFRVSLDFGPGSSGGSGEISFALPFEAKVDGYEQWVTAKLFSSNGSVNYGGIGNIPSGATSVVPFFPLSTTTTDIAQLCNNPGGGFGQVPTVSSGYPLQNGSNVFVGGVYEIE